MAFRTTIYCGDDVEEMLQTLLRVAKDDPAAWSFQTGKPAPTNTNQLFSLLIEIGYDLVTGREPAAMLGEPQPVWQTTAETGTFASSSAWADIPPGLAANPNLHPNDAPFDVEHYHSLLKNESNRRGISIESLLDEWRAQQSAKLPPIEDDPLWSMVGIGHSGLGDVSENVDKYLVEDRTARMAASEES